MLKNFEKKFENNVFWKIMKNVLKVFWKFFEKKVLKKVLKNF